MLKDKKKIRVLTLGTGSKPFTPLPENTDKSVILLRKDEFMINIDSFSADYFLLNQFEYIDKDPTSYVRVQTESKFNLDSTRVKDLDGM